MAVLRTAAMKSSRSWLVSTVGVSADTDQKGEAQIKITVEPGGELIRVVNWQEFKVQMNGRLNANGAGSRGTSSPDAKPGSIGD